MVGLVGQLLKFGVVGVAATAIDFGVMVAMTELAGWDPVLSAGVSFVVSLAFNYVASMRFVFARRDDLSRARELAIFVALSLVGLAINEALMWLGVNALSISYLVVKVAATCVVMLWNFVSRKRWLDAS
ncbi:MAG TPA: GtrA family protein [Olsenella sp.]|nr:GtrA family protein [Olsenella sp.]